MQNDTKPEYEQKLSTLETKIDALLAYTQSLEASQSALTKDSQFWQTRYEQLNQQQTELRIRLETVVSHLKKLETAAEQ